MFNASTQTLKLLAALVWFSGAAVLFTKGFGMFFEAQQLNPGQFWTWLALSAGLMLGSIKARYLFSRLCTKNLRRIEKLAEPRLWHFYRTRFFAFLLVMSLSGLYVSQKAHGDYSMLIIMIIVDLSLATALLASGSCFWKKI
jgi:hypothetical protein